MHLAIKRAQNSFRMRIKYNKPYLTGKEVPYIYQAVQSGHISGNGDFTKKCHRFFEDRFNFKKCLLTTSCTDALEMSTILLNIQPGDEIIIPAYAFVSTATAFVLRGAKIIFADSYSYHPNIDPDQIEQLITPKTKAIVVVHYAGIACDMDKIMSIANKSNLYVVEDAAQAVNAYYKGKPLGGIGHLGVYSFHETKNIISGEGGLLIINDEAYMQRAEVIWEKGTNRAAFFRGEVNKYGWIDVGSSFLPSEIISAFLYAQLEKLEDIQEKRIQQWNQYYDELSPLEEAGYIKLPIIPDYSTNNAHIFYALVESLKVRDAFIKHLREHEILAVFHYLSLHKSDFYADRYNGDELEYADYYSDCLVRLPLYYELSASDISYICETIKNFFEQDGNSRG